MPKVSASSNVPSTAEEIFSFLADYRNIPRLQPHFSSAKLMSKQEVGLGAVVELKGRFKGVPMHVHNRIIAFSPPYRLVSISEGSILSRSAWELHKVESDPPLTRVTLNVDYSLRNVLGGLFMGMGSALWPLFQLEIQRMTEDSLRRLAGHLSE